ncbi:hypothetical protein [uncultured Ruegeria sp.]|uniref:hypothetical protein n=1 Tax=uncultured Ruegeria sp. TaxID=259304 RepID=UPI002633753E|nr:hypothetical protein [uncultured Ruegeria sp.]
MEQNKYQQKQRLKAQIDQILVRYSDDYENLAQQSEALDGESASLKSAYKSLDGETGLNDLYEKLARLEQNS